MSRQLHKTPSKRAAWLERTQQILGVDEHTARTLLDSERQQSVRINPLQGDPQHTIAALQSAIGLGEQYPWAADCYAITQAADRMSDLSVFKEGRAYIQNAASWLPVIALDAHAGETILDVCAAPGGKTSHIAAIANNGAYITANDNSRGRLAKMQANLARLGVENITYTLYDATQLARKLEGQQFDKILLDAPCSGEGMMRLSRDKDFATWSVAHIKRLQQMQKPILTQSWQLLKPGGTLVYSTCTMAPEENEAVVDYLLRTRPDAHVRPFTLDVPNSVLPMRSWNGRPFNEQLQGCLRLAPSENIEAFFVCKLHKSADLLA